MHDDKDSKLGRAYSLKTPQDNVALYRDWARTYDEDFVGPMDYRVAENTAGVLIQRWDGEAPVLDVGAGTGEVGLHLRRAGVGPVDGLDISGEMLAVAVEKGACRKAIVGDLTARVPIDDCAYGAVISAGTFTLGHVGPEGLDECLRVGRSGALYAISVNPDHWVEKGFEAKFDALAPRIRDFEIVRIRGYGPKATGPHKDDIFNVCVFRKA